MAQRPTSSHALAARCRRTLLAMTADERVPEVLRRIPGRLGMKPLHNPDLQESELRLYLGDSFKPGRLQRSFEVVDDEFAQIGDEAAFYRTSQGYLYNLTAFAMWPTKDPYLAEIEALLRPRARLLDYGCGIGSDGLYLSDRGYRVGFADFANPSTEYLRWRLGHRGLQADIYDLDHDEIPSGFDLAFSFDVIEHVPDALAFLSELETHARRVLVNLLEPEEGETPLHHQLPVAELLRYAAGNGLQRYALYWGRSHLVLYEPGAPSRPSAARRARQTAARLEGRAPARV